MVKTQIQVPEHLYREAKRVAREREISFAEVVRRGIEYITRVYPAISDHAVTWSPPEPCSLGEFLLPVEDWRLAANDPELER